MQTWLFVELTSGQTIMVPESVLGGATAADVAEAIFNTAAQDRFQMNGGWIDRACVSAAYACDREDPFVSRNYNWNETVTPQS